MSELTNIWLFVAVLAKAALLTGFGPGIVMACICARCCRVPTADRRWGFDRALVSDVECILCRQPIGAEPYELETAFARFGEMLFRHKRCSLAAKQVSGGGQLAHEGVIPLQRRATSPPRKEERSA